MTVVDTSLYPSNQDAAETYDEGDLRTDDFAIVKSLFVVSDKVLNEKNTEELDATVPTEGVLSWLATKSGVPGSTDVS